MLELKLLGTPQILLDGRVVRALSATKSQALLFYLAVNDRPQSRLALAALLWPDKRESDALTNLRQAVHHLRNGLPDYLLINRLTLALNPALPCQIDAVHFEEAIGEKNPLVDRQRALDRYTGDFLAGFYVEEAQPFDEWAVVRRERLHHLATTTLYEVVAHLAERQELAPGLRYTNQWLALEPWREEAHRYKMQFLAWHGQGQAALEHYEQCQRLLREELNAAPDAETIALYEQIRTGKLDKVTNDKVNKSPSHPVTPSPCHDWGEAPAPTPFYGRIAERTLIARWLKEEQCRLVAILGMGGVGKTALAVQVAHQVAPHFEVVIWRSLLNAPPLMEILPGWLQILSQQQLTKAPATLDVSAVVWTPDGACLISGSWDQSIRIWDVQTGQMHQTLHYQRSEVRCLAISPDGILLASGSADGTLHLWDLARQQLVHTFTYSAEVNGVAWRPDGQMLGICGRSFIYLWARAEMASLTTLTETAEVVRSVAFSPDGLLLASGDNHGLKLWQVNTGLIHRVFSHLTPVVTLAWTPNGAWLVSASHNIRVWDWQRGQTLAIFQGYNDSLLSVAFSANGAWVASSHADNIIRLWDTTQWQVDVMLVGHEGFARDVRFSPDSATLISGSIDQTVRLWDSRRGWQPRILRGHNSLISSMTTSPDGRLIATSSHDRTVWLWDAARGQVMHVLRDHRDLTQGLAFSPDSQLLATGSGDTTIRLWDTYSGQALRTLHGHAAEIHTLLFDQTGTILMSGGADETIRVWDIRSGQHLHTLFGHTAIVNELALSPDGAILASCGSGDQTIRLWDWANGTLHHVLQHGAWVVTVAFSPDGQTILSGCADGQLRLWDVQSGQCLRVFRAPGPYADTDITGVTGISEAQKVALKALGAVETVR